MQFPFLRDRFGSESLNHPPSMLFVVALFFSAFSIGFALLQHRPRMGQELLRPATRNHYISSLVLTLAKRSFMLWVGLSAGLCFLAYATDTFPKQNPVALTLKYLAISFAVQLPAFGLCLRMGLWNSQFGMMLGMQAVCGLQMALLSLWWRNRESWTWPVILLVVLILLAAGAAITAWARRRWLEAELA